MSAEIDELKTELLDRADMYDQRTAALLLRAADAIASLSREVEEAREAIAFTLNAKIIYTGGGDEESIAECGMDKVEPVRVRLAALLSRDVQEQKDG